VGVSTPCDTEQAALKSAWNNAVQSFASSIATRFKGQTDISVSESGYDSEVADAFTLRVETASFSTQVQLTGVREAAHKVDRQADGGYMARVLAHMSAEDYQKAMRYIENEEASFLAYRFFQQKNPELPRLASGEKPAGYPDYYSWLRGDCVILSVKGGQNWAAQLEAFVKKLYRQSLVFACVIDALPSRVVYGAPKYSAGLYTALGSLGMIDITRQESGFVLTPGAGGIEAFRKAVADMKDASKIFVTGIEIIQSGKGRVVNTGNLVINQFKTLASRRFGMSAVNYELPARFTQGDSVDEDGIIAYIKSNLAAFPARYAAIVYAETALEPAMPEYNIGARTGSSCNFTLYDVASGEVLNSETSQTNAIFSLADEREATILNESRRALRFLFDPKNQPGLEEIMAAVLEKL
jgi:hypothetical protein